MILATTAIIVMIVAFSACSSGSGAGTTEIPTQSLIEFTPSPTSLPITPTPTQTPPPSAAELLATAQVSDAGLTPLDAVLRDLAENESVDPSAIQIIQVDAVQWPGTRLDCEAEAGAESLPRFEGALIRLLIDENVYTYHASGDAAFVRCDAVALEDVSPQIRVLIDPVAADLVAIARMSLATELDLPQRRIVLLGLEAVTWEDNSLGCPVEGVDYTADPLPGYRIVLTAGEREYTYHTDFVQAIPCSR